MNITDAEKYALIKCTASLDVVEASTKEFKTDDNPLRGKCYLASVALFEFLGGIKNGYHLIKAIELDDHGKHHYWVESPTHAILDATVEQFHIMGKDPPYAMGGKRVNFQRNMKKHLPILEKMRSEK